MCLVGMRLQEDSPGFGGTAGLPSWCCTTSTTDKFGVGEFYQFFPAALLLAFHSPLPSAPGQGCGFPAASESPDPSVCSIPTRWHWGLVLAV